MLMRTLVAALLGGLSLSLSAQAATSYRITDIGRFYPTGINDVGQVVGGDRSYGSSYNRSSVLWSSASGLEYIVGSGSHLSSINNAGQVVGTRWIDSESRESAFLWSRASGLQDVVGVWLGFDSSAAGINDAGLVVGGVASSTYLWDSAAGGRDLAGPVHYFQAHAINNAGQVVGERDGRAHLWNSTTGTFQDLGVRPGSTYSYATSINDLGQVVGHSLNIDDMGYQYDAYFWSSASGMLDLGVLPGRMFSLAYGVNDAGLVVGSSRGVGTASDLAFLWSNGEGMRNLNDLVDAADPLKGRVTLASATAINESGQIVGYGSFANGEYGAFLLTPVPEPESWAMLVGGLLALGIRNRHRQRVPAWRFAAIAFHPNISPRGA